MKSICIKTNNFDTLDYLLNLINTIEQDNVCFSCNEFKLYKNTIVHYTGNNQDLFCAELANVLSYLVIDKFEEDILKRLIFNNYFYFNSIERSTVLKICLELLSENSDFSLGNRHQLLFDSFYNYICDHKSIVLDGFINFRLKNYVSFLDSILDIAVNKFIVEREYLEFISLLKLYINSQRSNVEYVHLVYYDMQSILLDQDKNIINLDENMFSAKYLSDITFSSNDYALNTLLTMLPKKIYVHLIDNATDEFINTLQLVFENKIEICTDCNICRIYKNANKVVEKKGQ